MARRVGPTLFERKLAQSRARKADDEAGKIADGTAVRIALIERMKSGELTHEQVLTELAKIKRKAKRDGRPVQADYFKR